MTDQDQQAAAPAPHFPPHADQTPSAPPQDAAGADLPDIDETLALQPVEPAYVHVVRLTIVLNCIPLLIGIGAMEFFILRDVIAEAGGPPAGVVTAVLALLCAAMVITAPTRRFQRLGYALSGDSLRVARGQFFRVDTIVPFVRVQHIDVASGPLERPFGLSRLVVHTAGTHNSIVTLPGLTHSWAEALRDTIRKHIQTDAQ
jgi:uncharacterized protein